LLLASSNCYIEVMNIVFLCPHGGAKSVIAAAYFNRMAAEQGLPYVAAAAAAEDPYDSVPEAVAGFLQRDGFDVHAFVPRPAEPGEIDRASRVIAIGCELTSAQVERWDDVPQASEDLQGSAAAIRRHVDELLEELRASR
jgi:arsenate reductase (thioredoxin)